MNDIYLVHKDHTDELYHYGVKGMKWGHRKKYPTSDIRNRYDSTKKASRQAHKEYSKSFDKAYNYSNRHYISQFISKKRKAESNRLWDDAMNKAEVSRKAKNEYKQVKKERKKAINDAYNQIQKDTTFKDKFLYNEATRKKAAKYVVDNGMSVNDAKKKANGEAIRNTAILLGAYGAVSVATMKYAKH